MEALFKLSSRVNLKLLQSFVLVARESSFRRAAERSCKSPATLSAQIRVLEEQVGVALFHRTTRHVELSEEGEQLLGCVQRALLEVETGLRNIRERAQTRRGRITLGCLPTIAETRLGSVLAAFGDEFPGVEVEVRELLSDALFESLRSGEVEFAIGPTLDSIEFIFEPLLEDPLFAIVPRKFAPSSGSTISLSELAALPLLVLNPRTALRRMLDDALQRMDLPAPKRHEFANVHTLISMAAAGLGAAVLPGVALPARLDRSSRVLRITSPGLTRQIALVALRGSTFAPASQRFGELIKREIGSPQDAVELVAPQFAA